MAGVVPLDQGSDGAILEAVDLTKHFRVRGRGRGTAARGSRSVHAMDNVSLALYPGHVTALVGESGSGKSTVARVLMQLYPRTSGTILLRGRPVRARHGRAFRRYVRDVQMVFQDPFSSLNPTRTIRHHLSRPLQIHKITRGRHDRDLALESLLNEVSLTPPRQFLEKFPHELSGGQRQRIAVARALASNPAVILADEPVSMLDVSIRLGILNLLGRLAAERHLALLYITHDIASARYFAENVLVMYAGQLIEGGPSEAVTQEPAHPYTQLLIASAPDPDRIGGYLSDVADTGEPGSLIDPPAGCRFQPRCPYAMAICATQYPSRSDLGGGHWTHCWLHSGGESKAGRYNSA